MSIITLPAGLIPASLDLTQVEGNGLVIIGAVSAALRHAGNSGEIIDTFRKEAMSGDYDHCIAVAMAYTQGAGQTLADRETAQQQVSALTENLATIRDLVFRFGLHNDPKEVKDLHSKILDLACTALSQSAQQ
jgi:hypothetical protein